MSSVFSPKAGKQATGVEGVRAYYLVVSAWPVPTYLDCKCSSCACCEYLSCDVIRAIECAVCVWRTPLSWAFLLTVKRDTQKERTTKSRKSWGAKAVRVRATGSPRAHPPEVVGHGRRSPRFRNPLIGALRGTQHVVKRAAISRTRHRLQPFSTKGARCGADARFFSSWTAAVWSQATGRGFKSPRRQAQAGSGGRCAKDCARARGEKDKPRHRAVG